MRKHYKALYNITKPARAGVLSLVLLFALLSVKPAGAEAIRLDGRFDDWADKTPVLSPAPSALVRSVRVTNGVDHVFVEMQLDRKIMIQQANPLTLLADADGDQTTGLHVASIGADVQYNFGSLEALRHTDGSTKTVHQTDIGISWAPTFSADRYEIALPLSLFGFPEPGSIIAVAVAELPDIHSTATVVSHELTRTEVTPGEISPEKLPAPYIRVLTMNVLFDGLFEKADIYERLFRALDPDILLLSEIYAHSADQVSALLNERFPAKNERREWYGVGTPGKVTISRYPFLATDIILEDLYTLIDVPGFEEGLFVIHTHLECCDRDALRQQKVDAILSELESSRADRNSILYDYHEKPLIFSGDLNLVGDSRQYYSLVNGINADLSAAVRTEEGAAAKKFVEAISYHTNGPFTFTWRDDSFKWPPGKLDFTFYTDPDVVLGKSFVLYTPDMDPDVLKQYGLFASDSLDASDHLAHVIDVAPGSR